MPDVILKDQYGEDVTYPDVDTVLLNTEGGTATYVSEHLIQNQAQADWNQTDDTQPDYIKNKPFYEYEGLVDILPITTYEDFALNSPFDVYCVFGNPDFTFTIGETYKVYWDGAEYECIAQDASSLLDEGAVVVGDASGFGLFGNNEPFIIEADAYGTIYISLTDTEDGGSHSVKIAKESILTKCLDDKYLSIMGYVEEKEVDILPFTTYENFTFNETYGIYGVQNGANYTLNIGETYIVHWDGEECECVAQDASGLLAGCVVLGNATNWGLSGNGEKFVIGAVNGAAMYFSTTDTESGGSHSVRIAKTVDGHYEIKEEYNPQPDWNEVDSTSGSYIVNKPFGTISAGTVVAPETAVSCTHPFVENTYYGIVSIIGFNVGWSYNVIFDGNQYTLIAEEVVGAIGVQYDKNDATFTILDNFNNSNISMAISTQGEHTYSITIAEDVVQKIDAKYIPEIDGLPEVTTDDNDKTLVVSDGVWTVAEPVKGVPEVTASDNGKFLRVVNGVWGVDTVLNAEEVSF